jgi:phosphatidylglycerophosphate synthase
MTIAELRARVQPPTSNPYDRYFTKRVSVFVTALLAPWGITANQVSAVNVFVGLAACGLIARAHLSTVIAGVILLHVYAVLDSVDGELARFRRQFSLNGLFLEDLSAFYLIVGFPLAVAICAQRTGSGAALLLLALSYAVFGRTAMAVARRAVIRSIHTKRPVSPAPPTDRRERSPGATVRRFVDDHLLNHTNIRVVVSTALAVEMLGSHTARVAAVLMGTAVVGLLVREGATIVHLLRGHLDDLLLETYADARTMNTDASSADGFHLARS